MLNISEITTKLIEHDKMNGKCLKVEHFPTFLRYDERIDIVLINYENNKSEIRFFASNVFIDDKYKVVPISNENITIEKLYDIIMTECIKKILKGEC